MRHTYPPVVSIGNTSYNHDTVGRYQEIIVRLGKSNNSGTVNKQAMVFIGS